MRKILAIIFTAICFLLCACDPISYSVDREELNDVVSVELIKYENSKQKEFFSWVPDQFDELAPFVLDNATTLEVLPLEKTSDFLDAFLETEILHTYYAYDSPKDICIKLNYENGNFLIVWANYAKNYFGGYIGKYYADGSVLSFWGCFSALDCYTYLVNEYFNYNLE